MHFEKIQIKLKKHRYINEYALKNFKKVVNINFYPKKNERCWQGDWDVVDYAWKANPKNNIILTVESILSGEKYKSIRLNRKILQNSFHFDFSIPLTQTKDLIGMFICRDNKHEGSCIKKSFINAQKYAHHVITNKNKPKNIYQADMVHYFQLMIQIGRKIYYINDQSKSKNAWIQVSKLFKDDFENDRLSKMLLKISNLNRQIGSFPIELSKNNNLSLVFPRIDRKKCAYIL